MKTIILFYSHSGNTKTIATEKATQLGADIEEITEAKKPNMLIGIYRAMKRKKTDINPIKFNLGDYDKIIIMSPVWGAHPVSAINSVISNLPAGKKVELIMVSGGGGTKKSAKDTKAAVIARGCEIMGYTDLKAMREGDKIISSIIK